MAYTAAVITVSDKGARGERQDKSGPAVAEILKEHGFDVLYTSIIPDEQEEIEKELIACSDQKKLTLVVTTGGTGFSSRDVTPEATLAVIERQTRGIPEAMRMESMKVTPRGCLSRSEAGIRGKSLIINLPGSEKAARENLLAVMDAVCHGLDMLCSEGSADCAAQPEKKKQPPSMDQWLKEAKCDSDAGKVGMYLVHNGVVRQTAKACVRDGMEETKPVTGMIFSCNEEKVKEVIEAAGQMDGIFYVRVWLNEGKLQVGDDIMYVMIGGDIRPHVVETLQYTVGRIKNECVIERELN